MRIINWVSIVSEVACLLDDRGYIPDRDSDISLLVLEPTQSPIHAVSGILFPGDKAVGA
jgi:hypothetical protein